MPRPKKACPFPGCQYSCVNKEDLICHRWSKHPEDPSNPPLPHHLCRVRGCGMVFERRQRLREHEAKEHKIGRARSLDTCKFCGIQSRSDNIRRHMPTCRQRPATTPDSGVDLTNDNELADTSIGTPEQQDCSSESQTTVDQASLPEFDFSAAMNGVVDFLQFQLDQDTESYMYMV